MRSAAYADIEYQVLPGDIIAFAGSAFISRGISAFTKSPVTHVGVVAGFVDKTPIIVQSTTLSKGRTGVFARELHSDMADAELTARAVWWLPLSDAARARFQYEPFKQFIWEQNGKQYDKEGIAAFAARTLFKHDLHDIFGWKPVDKADYLFCSTVTSASHQSGCILPKTKDFIPQRIAPAHHVGFKLYREAVQIVGAPLDIPNFNSVEVQC